MTIPVRFLGLLGLTVAIVGAGYAFAPGPAPSQPQQPTSAPAAKASLPLPAPVVVQQAPPTTRAPVPLATRTHTTYFPAPPDQPEQASLQPGDKPMDKIDGSTPTTDGAQQPADDAEARKAIEFDGYKNVRGLVKDANGVWRGKAMRGRTEIAIRVNPDGSVSAE